MTNLKYHSDERVDIVKIKYRNGEEKELYNQKCLEILKKESLRIDSVQLFKKSKNIEAVYSKDVCNRWINLLRTGFVINIKASYTITDDYHIIDLNYSMYDGIGQLYINLILFRYLWYSDNNNLIYRIFDIKEKCGCSIDVCITLAHYYDNFLQRDPTFNLFIYTNPLYRSIFHPVYEYTINTTYDNLLNKKIPHHCYMLMYSYLKLILTGDYENDRAVINRMWERVRSYEHIHDKNTEIMNLNFLNYIFDLKLSLSSINDVKEGDLLMNVIVSNDPAIIKFSEWYPSNISRQYIVGRTSFNTITTLSKDYYKKLITNEN